MKKPKPIKPLTPRQFEAKLKPYAVEVGRLVYSWNHLQHVLGGLFWMVSGIANGMIPLAAWNAVPSDRTQRDMLRAATEARFVKDDPDEKRVREDILWVVARVNELASHRNNAVHAPFSFLIGVDGVARLEPMSMTRNKRALNLVGKDVVREFRLYREYFDSLAAFASTVDYCWRFRHSGVVSIDWPTRPVLPHIRNRSAT
jgi:hypothetical protein